MGMFENYENVVNPTGPWELADSCTACQGKGYTNFPIHVSIGIEEKDDCPFGCPVPSETDEYYTEHEPEVALDPDLQDAFYLSLRKVPEIDRFLILSNHMRLRGIKPLAETVYAKHFGAITTDYAVEGSMEVDATTVDCIVPAYLVGAVVDLDITGRMTVQYEYMGSRVRVEFTKKQASAFRFAYSWDNDYSTHSLTR